MPEEQNTLNGGEVVVGCEGAEQTIKRLHFVYHVVAGTNQLVKVEELDETTLEAKEVPLPPFIGLEDGVSPPWFTHTLPAPPRPFRMDRFNEAVIAIGPEPKAGPLKFVPAQAESQP